ncbi:MAG: hypothetical protein GYA34_05385 [Chloroflexi bacterium]|nr:hypothetical protein [Chloroflexota bacterium]
MADLINFSANAAKLVPDNERQVYLEHIDGNHHLIRAQTGQVEAVGHGDGVAPGSAAKPQALLHAGASVRWMRALGGSL